MVLSTVKYATPERRLQRRCVNLKRKEKQGGGGRDWGHEWAGQHVYLEPWCNEGVESMPLAMELFLLVRHTHPPLRMKMEDIHTHTQKHTFTQPHSRWWRTTLGVSSNMRHQTLGEGGGVWIHWRWQPGNKWILDYLVIVDFSQGLLMVSEKKSV